METVYFNGTECHTYGSLPAVGSKAPAFDLVTKDLQEIRPDSFEGKKIVLNIFPSLDTPVCAASVRRFNAEAAGVKDTVVVCVSMDLPFAASRFCTAEGIEECVVASAFRSPLFGEKYGVQIVDGPLKGLLTRAVIIIDKDRNVVYRDLVEEITHEPDYAGAIDVIKNVK